MNLKDPKVSRLLGILIEKVDYKDQERFLDNAKKAKNLRAFLKTYSSYRKIKS
jgi:hypothetical protein